MTTTIYLTGVSNPAVREVAHENTIGVLLTPTTYGAREAAKFPVCGVDNGMYGLAKRHLEHTFDAEKFFAWLDTLPRSARFVAAPDVLHFLPVGPGGREVPVGDAKATLAQFPAYARRIRQLGHRVALVGQDGMEECDIPWELVDAIFLGGSDAWKLGAGARALVAEARRRGLWVHMGRVNSGKRFAYAAAIGCDSADGTFLAFGPTKNLPRLLSWLGSAAADRQLKVAA